MAIVCMIYIFKRDMSSKNHPCFMYHNFNDFMENEPYTKLCSVLISSYEVMTLQNIESGGSDVILRM